jgi:hypothetical protein
MKRARKNSLILGADYKNAKNLGLSVATYKKYIQICLNSGWITREPYKNGYRVINFAKILREIHQKTNLFVGKHSLIEGNKSTNTKEVENEITDLLMLDNIIKPQQFQIKKKQQFIDDVNFLSNPTEESQKTHKITSSQKKIMKMGVKCAEKEVKNMIPNKRLITSARHTSRKIGISVSKANKKLNSSLIFERNEIYKTYQGVNFALVDHLKEKYPKACIIPMLHVGLTKVSFGSELTLRSNFSLLT